MMELLLAAAYALICLAALALVAWLADGWHGLQSFAGWRFLPSVAHVLRHPTALQVDESCLGLTAEVFSAAPYALALGLTLRAGSSSLLLATAAALTAPGLPEADRAAMEGALAPIGMQPERVARRWQQLGTCSLAGHEALLVQDGKQKRFFLCTNGPSIIPSHLFSDKEYALSGEEWRALRDDLYAQLAPFPAMWHYYTALWTENGPASIVYLGAVACRWQMSEAALQGLERLQNAGFSLHEGPESLLITAAEAPDSPLQMICQEAEPTAFADALCSLRAQWKRRKRTLRLLFALACCTCLSAIPLEMTLHVPALTRLTAASALPLLVFAGAKRWQLRLPKRCISVLLPVALACLLGAVLPLTLLLPGTEGVLSGTPAIALAVLTMASWGTQTLLFLRQKGRKALGILPLLLGLGACLYLAGTLSGPLYAAFGAVLGALLLLPVGCAHMA